MTIDIKHGDTIEFNGVPVVTFTKHRMASHTEMANFIQFAHEAQDPEDFDQARVDELEEAEREGYDNGHGDGLSEGIRGAFDHTVDVLHELMAKGKTLAEAIKELDYYEIKERVEQ